MLRLLLPKSLILCKMGPLGGQNPLSWILLAVQAEQLHFKSACALFPFRSAFTLAGFAHLRSLHPTPPFAKIFDFVQNGSSLEKQNPLSWILLAVRFSWLRF